ncbi:hypothetical protein ACKWTF_013998 [Chironomus riparius]
MDGCMWIPFNAGLNQSQLVVSATDGDGGAVCIGRTNFSGELIPGKALIRHSTLHFTHNGQEHRSQNFEVLLNTGGFTWVASSNGSVPPQAVVGGRSSNGETLYVGRAKHLHLTIPGKIHPSHKCAYIGCDNREHSKPTYEVLVRQGSSGWVPPTCPPVNPPIHPPIGGPSNAQWVHFYPGAPWPGNAVIGGVYREGGQRKHQYVARKTYLSSVIVGYAYQNGPFYGGLHGKEISSGDFEVLVQNGNVFPHDGF